MNNERRVVASVARCSNLDPKIESNPSHTGSIANATLDVSLETTGTTTDREPSVNSLNQYVRYLYNVHLFSYLSRIFNENGYSISTVSDFVTRSRSIVKMDYDKSTTRNVTKRLDPRRFKNRISVAGANTKRNIKTLKTLRVALMSAKSNVRDVTEAITRQQVELDKTSRLRELLRYELTRLKALL